MTNVVQIGNLKIGGCTFSQSEHLAANRLREICEAHSLHLPKPLHRDIIRAWGQDIEASIRLGRSSKL